MVIGLAIIVMGFLSLVFMFKFISRFFCVIFDLQKVAKLLLIVLLVWLDICLLGSSCRNIGEAFIHMLIMTTPFMYIFVAGKTGKEG